LATVAGQAPHPAVAHAAMVLLKKVMNKGTAIKKAFNKNLVQVSNLLAGLNMVSLLINSS